MSRSTVSRVLNDLDAAPAETRARVVAAAGKLGYRPAAAARALRGGRWDMVALVVGDVAQPYFSALAKAVESSLRRSGHSMMLIGVDRDITKFEGALDSLEPLSLSGIVVAVARDLATPTITRRLERVIAGGTPVVTVSQRLDRTSVPAVLADHEGAAYQATSDLLARGLDDIVLAAGDAASPHVALVVSGFLEALPPDQRDQARSTRVVHSPFEIRGTYEAVRTLVATRPPQAWVAAAAYPALGILMAYETPLPAIACCETVPMLEALSPTIRTYGPDWHQYGDAVVDAVLRPRGSPAPLMQVIASDRRS